jgi:hypothetical protein
VACAVSIALGLIFHPRNGDESIFYFVTAQKILVAFSALALYVLAFQIHRLGRGWWPRDAHIAYGFVLMLTVNSMSLLTMQAGWNLFHLSAQRLAWCATILAMGWWSWSLWSPEVIPDRATPEEIAMMLEMHRREMEAVAEAIQIIEAAE